MSHPKDITEPHAARPFDLDAFVIGLEGEFDIAERQRLNDAYGLATSARKVVVDFKKADYIDSTVLEGLVGLHTSLAQRGAKLVLVAVPEKIARIIAICDLERFFDIRDTLHAAIDDAAGESPRIRRLSLSAGSRE